MEALAQDSTSRAKSLFASATDPKPSSCRVGDVWVDTSTSPAVDKRCLTAGTWTAVGGSSLPEADTTAFVKGSSDATKLLRFEVDGFTTGTTRVLTPPNYDGTIATLAGTEIFTNKTLTTPTIASFASANHDHTNSAGGGQLNASSVFSAGTVPAARGGLGVDASGCTGAFLWAAGAPTCTSTNGSGNFTRSAGTLAIASGKTLTSNNTLTINSTDGITMTTPTTSFTAARTDAAQTFTGAQAFGTITATSVNFGGSKLEINYTASDNVLRLLSTGGYGQTATANSAGVVDTVMSRKSANVYRFGVTGGTTFDSTGTIEHSGDNIVTPNTAQWTRGQASENLTLSTGGTTTATAANLVPANAIIEAITYRVSTSITTATDFSVKVTGGNNFVTIGTATAAQTGLTGGSNKTLVPAAYGDQFNASSTTLTVTTTGTPGAGAIRLTVFYRTVSPPAT